MSIITIHTDNEQKINLLQTFLNELGITFEINRKEQLTDLQKERIRQGINDIEAGKFSTSEMVKKRAIRQFGQGQPKTII
jgi:hypothetical protein